MRCSVKESAARYVCTRHHHNALHLLEQKHTVIISGDAGVGKTTLADQLFFYYASKGFSAYKLLNSIRDAEPLLDEQKSQVFYFDDFLGRNYLEAIRPHEDSATISFIKAISKRANARFILTSRTIILNRGKQLSDLFSINNLDQNEYELRIDTLTTYERAQLLYNHIWFSKLSEAYVDEFYRDRRYRNIISHRNFNPRIIEFITDIYKIRSISPGSYYDYIINTLNNPAEIWGRVYDHQLTPAARMLVCLTVFNGRSIADDSLFEAFSNLAVTEKVCSSLEIPSAYDQATRLVAGAMLNRKQSHSGITYDLFNPAVGDYILRKYLNSVPSLLCYFGALNTYGSIAALEGIFSDASASSIDRAAVLKTLVGMKLPESHQEVPIDYKVALARFACDHLPPAEIASFVKDLVMSTRFEGVRSFQVEIAAELLEWSVREQLVAPEAVVSKYFDVLVGRASDSDALKSIVRLIHLLPEEAQDDYNVKIAAAIVDYTIGTISDEIREADAGVDDRHNTHDLRRAVAAFVEDVLGQYEAGFTSEDVSAIVDSCNIDKLQDYYLERYDQPDDDERRIGPSVPADNGADIDDLFDRSK